MVTEPTQPPADIVGDQRKLFYIDGPMAGQVYDAPYDTMRFAGDPAYGATVIYTRWRFVIDHERRQTIDAMSTASAPSPADVMRAMAKALGIDVVAR